MCQTEQQPFDIQTCCFNRAELADCKEERIYSTANKCTKLNRSFEIGHEFMVFKMKFNLNHLFHSVRISEK